MIDEFEARRRVLEAMPQGGVESLPLREAAGRVAAESVHAGLDLPGFDNSAMDGYAVAAEQAGSGAELRVSGEQPAGLDLGLELRAGEAIRIFTGAAIPSGADAVVMQEDIDRDGDVITVREAAQDGDFIRRRGADVCVGQKLFEAGDRIGAGRVALLASQGISTVSVVTKPRVAVITTGDELRDPDGDTCLGGGEIFNSNGPMLAALVERFGGRIAAQLHAVDEVEALKATLQSGLDQADIVVVVGGVSVGERDLVKDQLAELGVEADFWRVRVKPGKPFLFGKRGDQGVFGLPGNPVSAFTTFLLFVAPALQQWLDVKGSPESDAALAAERLPLAEISAVAGEPIANRGDRPHYLRGRVDASGRFFPVGMQQSHAIFGLSQASALLRLEEGYAVAAGESLRLWKLDDL